VKKYISPLIFGFAAGVLQIVPVIKSFTCCLILPLAVFISLILDQKARKDYSRISMNKAVVFGLITGLTAAVWGTIFETLITLITKQSDLLLSFPELARMIESFPVDEQVKKEVLSLFEKVRVELINYGFSWFYTISILMNNLFVNTIFGIVVGLISAQIINNRNNSASIE